MLEKPNSGNFLNCSLFVLMFILTPEIKKIVRPPGNSLSPARNMTMGDAMFAPFGVSSTGGLELVKYGISVRFASPTVVHIVVPLSQSIIFKKDNSGAA